jgi:hypothetical protein
MTDFLMMSEDLGPLDFETFCSAYCHHARFIAAREHRSAADEVQNEGRRDGASHAA